MKTRAEIEFDFQKALGQADSIDGIADSLSGKASNLDSTMTAISNSWKGDNSQAYVAKGAVLKGKMDGTSGELHAIASAIRTIARRLYEAEMAALAVAEARTY